MKNCLFKNHLLKVFAVLLLAIISFAADSHGQKTKTNYYAHLQTEHAQAIKNYIGRRKGLRPAQKSDCKNQFGLDSLRQNEGESAHPYYAVADFNRDKSDDFAVVLYNTKRKPAYAYKILIFHGSKSGRYKLAYTAKDNDLIEGGIWINGFGANESKQTLTAGIFETDDAIWLE